MRTVSCVILECLVRSDATQPQLPFSSRLPVFPSAASGLGKKKVRQERQRQLEYNGWRNASKVDRQKDHKTKRQRVTLVWKFLYLIVGAVAS